MRFQAVCLVVAIAVLQGAVNGADFFRIASFNIEHLGSRTPGQQPIAIAEHIDLSGAIVVALQEINVTDTESDDPATPYDESRRNETLDTAFAILNQEGDTEWKYELLPSRTLTDTSQLVGVAWDSKIVNRDEAAFPIAISGTKIWDRRPHAIKLKYGDMTDVVLVPIHMKSNYGSADQGRATRKKEVDALVAQLPSVAEHFDDEEIIIGGDANLLKADEAAAIAYGNAGYRDTNSLDYPTCIGYGNGAPFVLFFLSDVPIFTFARQYILQAAEPAAHYDYLSDHQMIIMSFRVKNDNN